MFHVGQKVVCIFHMPENRRRADGVYPEKNGVYVIRSIFPDPVYGRELLRFEELTNPICDFGMEAGFDAAKFRPIVERKTDISIFTAMLTGTKVPEVA